MTAKHRRVAPLEVARIAIDAMAVAEDQRFAKSQQIMVLEFDRRVIAATAPPEARTELQRPHIVRLNQDVDQTVVKGGGPDARLAQEIQLPQVALGFLQQAALV